MGIRTEAIGEEYAVLIDNREPIPITVKVRLALENLTSTAGDSFTVVVPADTLGYLASVLTVINERQGVGLDAGITTTLGDQRVTDYDRDHVYQLPFAPGTARRVEQGYNGRFSHAGENALDFDLPEGTPVYAARGGVVADLEASFDRGCNAPRCMDYNNYVLVYHDDGTMADYAHLRKGGVAVEKGQRVEAGELLGYSGNTGYTTGPHLHFVVFLARGGERETIATRFRTDRVPEGEELVEGRRYSAQR